jgi:quercetin dioxygenase-like cupin family protein
MKDLETFINYGNYDSSKIKEILLSSNLDWDEFTLRQVIFPPHRETKTIPILFNPDFDSNIPTPSKNYHLFEEEIKKLESHFSTLFNEEGNILRAILVLLPAGKKIPTHIDKGNSLTKVKRCHLSIYTNDDCLFTVGEETRNFQEGTLWQINNITWHSVSNNGDTDRVHLIADWNKKNHE